MSHDDSKEYTFHNVTITIVADSPKEAYDKLCETLVHSEMEYATDTWSVPPFENLHDTEELFPE